jgi:hypothetical protein
MKTIAKLTLAACTLLVPCALVAQTYKCTDAYGKITYSGKKCSDLGLKDAGEVKDQIQSAPGYRPPPVTGGASTPSPSSAPAAQAPAPQPAPAPQEPEAPARRCFSVNTGKGTVTRCNDTPPESDAPPSNP